MTSSWNNCGIDIWFLISDYLRPEDTMAFAGICKKSHSVTDSEAFWQRLFNRFVRSRYKWLDVRDLTRDGTSIRDATIRELFKSYQPFVLRKNQPDSYDKATSKVCLQITQTFDEVQKIRTYSFKLKTRTKSLGKLAKKNRDEGCQLLQVKTTKFVPFPYDSEKLIIKSIAKTLSQGFRSYKLKILFCDQFGNSAGDALVFDPITSVNLYEWWEEKYTTSMF